MSESSRGALPAKLLPAQVRRLLDAAQSLVVAADTLGRIVYVNARAVESFGYTSAELLGQPIELLVPEAVAERHVWQRRTYQRAPEARAMGTDLDLKARRRDGSQFPVEISLTPVKLDGGEQVTIAGILDLTIRRHAQEQVVRLTRSYLTLAQMNQAIVRADDVDELFRDTCRIAVRQGRFLGAWIGVVQADDTIGVVAKDGKLDEYIDALRLTLDPADPMGQGPAAVALRENRACYSVDFRTDARTRPWQEAAARHGIRASATMPLRQDGAAVAAMSLYADDPAVFEEGVGELLEQVAENVSYALDWFAAERRLEEVAAQRRDLLRRLVTAQETERAGIAADIHDDSVQALAAIELRLGLLRRKADGSSDELLPLIDDIHKTLTTATGNLRQLLFELESPGESETWLDAVRTASAHIFEDDNIVVTVRCDDVIALPDVEGGQALRIVKEALINVRKHAQAAHVVVAVRTSGEGVLFTISDDGVGMPHGAGPEQPSRRPGHRGLATMRDRATVAGGWLRMDSSEGGRGVALNFWIPSRGAPDRVSFGDQ